MSENKNKSFLAIDLGASSGRAILGTIKNQHLELLEINRFSNPIIEINGRLYWNLFHLYTEIINSLKIIKSQKKEIISLGIDTWGVDFAAFGEDGELLRMPYSYRDTHTFGAPEKFFGQVFSQKTTYLKTGNQIMNFNTLFQLYTQKEKKNPVYFLAHKFLFTPDALSYLLTGNMVTEYTIASTSQLMNPFSRTFDEDLLSQIGLTREHFAPIVFPGTQIGTLNESVQKQTDLGNIPVIAVAGHDTASAILAIPAENENFAYLSSGTWSLMGIESNEPIVNNDTYTLNFTNEGGADGSIRLLKNICGMWIIEQCKKEWIKEKNISFDEIVLEAAISAPFKCYINSDALCFVSPKSMIEAIQNYCKKTNQFIPKTIGEISRCIFESLAFRYKQILEDLRKLSHHPIETLHIIGGGSQNNMLNGFTANALGIPVVAGPCEATALGNILLQAQAAGWVKDKKEIRKIVRNTIKTARFNPNPQDVSLWETHYSNYLSIFRENVE